MQFRRKDTITAEWLERWKIQMQRGNPPNKCALTMEAEYLREYLQGRAYISKIMEEEITKTTKRKIYNIYLRYARGDTTPILPRIQRKYPGLRWGQIWLNISGKHLLTSIRGTWYRAVHDIIPTNETLHKIGLRDMPTCTWCQQTDTIEHRLTACIGSDEIWSWTRARIAAILRMDDRHIPNTWPFLPEMHIWPPQRHNAIIWMLGNMVHYTLTEHPPLKRQEYIVYIRRARWKIQKWHRRRQLYGNYLDIIID